MTLKNNNNTKDSPQSQFFPFKNFFLTVSVASFSTWKASVGDAIIAIAARK
jgi:hypothetical protein